MAQKIPLNIKSPQRSKPYTGPVWIIRMFILLRNVQAYAEPLWQASGLARRNDGASGWLPENRQVYPVRCGTSAQDDTGLNYGPVRRPGGTI
jgi:hypothetical protein